MLPFLFLWAELLCVLLESKKFRVETKKFGVVGLVRLLQLSAAGEVFLEGTCPLSRCPQTAKFPAPCFWRTEQVGEKSDSFSRAERTRPLRPVSRLLYHDFENVPAERFQQGFLLLKPADTARRVPTGANKFRRNVFNGISFSKTGGHGTTCPYRNERIPDFGFCGKPIAKPQISCYNSTYIPDKFPCVCAPEPSDHF